VREGVQTGLDRRIDHLAADLHDQPAEERGIDREVDGNVTADTGAQLLLERIDLSGGKRVRRDDFGRGLAAVGGGQLAEGADDRGQLARRRFCASTPRKFAVVPSSFRLLATEATALAAAPRATSGLVVSALKSADSVSAWAVVARLCSTWAKAFESRASSNRAVA